MKKNLPFFVLMLVLCGCSQDDEIVVDDPQFFTSDIALFWQVFDNSTTNYSSQEFKDLYISMGSQGLKEYDQQKDIGPSLQNKLRNGTYLAYYKEIRDNTLDLSNEIETAEIGFDKFKTIYPDAKLFNVYFIVGAMTAGGRISKSGLLVAVEMFTKNESTDLENLDPWFQNVLRNKEYLPSIVLHEFIHKQQAFLFKNAGFKTTLEQSLIEGMADYLSHFVLSNQPFMNEHLHVYGDPKEEELWLEFKSQMDLNYESTEWLYTGKSTEQGHPADMGYYIGYKIVETYCEQFDSKEEAIKAMLSTTDYYQILEASGYGSKFD